MKVYVDELPKRCDKCPFCEYFEKDAHGKGKHEVACYFNGSLGNILYGNQISPKTCTLQYLTDYTKQVRKEVCDEIKKFAYDTFKEFGVFDEVDLEHILDQIQEEGEIRCID